MKVTVQGSQVIVSREDSPKLYSSAGAWGSAESRLMHHVKLELNRQGYDLIKKLMYKDGHMTADTQHYLRARKPSGKDAKSVMIWHERYQIEDAAQAYNAGEVRYMLAHTHHEELEPAPQPKRAQQLSDFLCFRLAHKRRSLSAKVSRVWAYGYMAMYRTPVQGDAHAAFLDRRYKRVQRVLECVFAANPGADLINSEVS